MGPGLLVMAAVFFGIAVLLPVTAAEASPSKGCSDIPFAVNRRNPIKQEIVKINLQKPFMTGLEAEAIFEIIPYSASVLFHL